ncbi:MAG: MerR family transcriptional regulator [Proteobacteria bacterium]|nr:MerR family transcriptional regulator [Pseudomonadota bacterium]
MEYRVEELATAAGLRVDTVRFYQGKGLIPPPRRQGRTAVYGALHLERLRRIRALLKEGFSLAQIQRLLDREREVSADRDRLLAALVDESVGSGTHTRAELAAEAQVPEALIQAAQQAGLVEPVRVDGEERFSGADLQMARAAFAILEAGFPIDVLLRLAVEHARNVQDVADQAIDLFDEYVRKAGEAAEDSASITGAFQTLLPAVTRLVALHFQRTLVNRALERLRGKGEGDALEAALAATESARLEVSWR